ncbi:portal protein [Pleomorphomonas sp. NRK KF1]|uniref:portal protein n=1 Tax=Pleomorphomonas sp. NRK KF1 TaxID=2943000 RepID=UPI002043C300|nr:portal protein [Pleomorphomonas sp. NRK KF1]MCM5554105.1 portal protein [Pleomorphomonas sp. NRK KF1]
MEARANETQVQYHRRRAEELKRVRQPWESTWTGLADFVAPHRLRLEAANERAISRKRILDPSGTFAWRTLASGMHSGLTSPARPWFRFATVDPELREWGPVKLWVDEVEAIERRMFQRSNVYTAFHEGYGDIGLFGQSCGILIEGGDDPLHMIQLLHGRFWIARDAEGRATTLYRMLRWSVEKIVRRFGLDTISSSIRSAYDAGRYDQTFDIWHAIEPRVGRDPQKIDKRNKPFLSNYWEVNGGAGSSGDGLLEESGFDSNPIICPPWLVCGDDSWAQSPGMDTIGDVKSLQAMVRDKLEVIAKLARPPLQGPTSLNGNPMSLLPGAVTFVDDPTGKGLRPVMEASPQIGPLLQDIAETRQRIATGFYADLFLMLSNMEGVQPRNQMEIAERKEEKLLALGPVLENIYNNQLEPCVDRAFEIGLKRNLFPPPPREIQNQRLAVEYISTLAQAQKAVATGAVERLVGFASQWAAMKPEVLDKLDANQSIDVYADLIGAPAAIVVPDDKVQEARAARAEAEQQAKMAQMAKTVAPAISAGADAVRAGKEAGVDPAAAQQLMAQLGIGGS